MKTMLKKLWKDEEGAVAVEYALITAVIALGLVLGFVAYRNSLSGSYNTMADRVAAQVPGQ